MATVGGGEVDDEPELLPGVCHVLPLEHALLCLGRPRHTLVQVQGTVHHARHCYHAPTYCLQQLKIYNFSKFIFGGQSLHGKAVREAALTGHSRQIPL